MKITKHTKRFVSIWSSVLMLILSVPTIAFAKEVVGTTPVSYVEDTSYTVSIPRYTKAQEYGEAVNTAANAVRLVSAQLNDETTLFVPCETLRRRRLGVFASFEPREK